MTARQLIGAWLAALALFGAVAFALVRVIPPARNSFRGAQIAVIGSSVTKHAIPAAGGGAGSLLGDGRTHLRMGISDISEREELSLLQTALDDRVELVFLEVNPFVRDLHGSTTRRDCDSLSSRVRDFAWQRRWAIGGPLRRLLGVFDQEYGITREPADLNSSGWADPERLIAAYPLRFHAPYCRPWLLRLVGKARRQGVKIVFVLAPRSQTAATFIPQQDQQLGRLARGLAGEMGVPIFAPPGPWSDRLFVDYGHMNLGGRQRFTAELRQWWTAGG